MPVKTFPMSVDHALKIIRETAADSSKVGIPQNLGFNRKLQDWQHVVTHRQIQRCLEDGSLVGKPKLDASGNWKCRMERFGSGALVRITVVAECNEHKDWRLYVTDWSKTDGP